MWWKFGTKGAEIIFNYKIWGRGERTKEASSEKKIKLTNTE